MKEGEGISQRTYMPDTQMQMTVWLWLEGWELVVSRDGQREGEWDISNSVNNKNKVNKVKNKSILFEIKF